MMVSSTFAAAPKSGALSVREITMSCRGETITYCPWPPSKRKTPGTEHIQI